MHFSDQWLARLTYSTLARPGVPLFLMITGTLLLVRNPESLQRALIHRLPRLIWPLLFWSVVYALWKVWAQEPVDWLGALFGSPVMYHLWYLYAALGIGLFTPVLAIVLKAGSHYTAYYAAIWFITVGLIEPFSNLLGKDTTADAFGLSTFLGLAGFLPSGALIYNSRKLLRRFPITLWISFGLSAFAAAAFTHWHSASIGAPSEFMLKYTSGPIIIMSALLYATLLSTPIPYSAERLAAVVGHGSLGIFGIHLLVLYFTWHFLGLSASSSALWLGIPLSTLLTTVVSLVIVLALRAVKPMRLVF